MFSMLVSQERPHVKDATLHSKIWNISFFFRSLEALEDKWQQYNDNNSSTRSHIPKASSFHPLPPLPGLGCWQPCHANATHRKVLTEQLRHSVPMCGTRTLSGDALLPGCAAGGCQREKKGSRWGTGTVHIQCRSRWDD